MITFVIFLVDHDAAFMPKIPVHRSGTTSLAINLGWFTGKNEVDKNRSDEDALSKDGKGIVSIMNSMESFKKSQRAGKMTASLVQELSSTIVEGSSPDGKIKVLYDGQQRPLSVDIDESYVSCQLD